MIDRAARTEVRRTVEDFLSDRIGAFAFDDRLFEIVHKSDDQTVNFVVGFLWYTYSDTSDHLVHLNKQGWNTVQRLLLLLDTEAELQEQHAWVWHSSQIVAAITFIAVSYFALMIYPLFVGGAISIGVASIRKRVRTTFKPLDPWNAWPFPSLDAISRALARSPDFQKQRHRPEIVGRRAESRFGYIRLPQFIEWPLSRLGWCFVSPVILFFQCWPLRVSTVQFVEPRDASAASALLTSR